MRTDLFRAATSTTLPHALLVTALLAIWWKGTRQRFFLLLGLAEFSGTAALLCAFAWIHEGLLPTVSTQLLVTLLSASSGCLFYLAAEDFGEVDPKRQFHWTIWLIPASLSVGLVLTGNFDSSLRINAAMGACGCIALGYQLILATALDRLASIFVWLRAAHWLLYSVQGPFASKPNTPLRIELGFGFAILVAGVLKSWRSVAAMHSWELRLLGEDRRLFERSTLARIKVDSDFRVTGWNPAAEALFGYAGGEAIGCSIFDLIAAPNERTQTRVEWERVLSTHEAKFSTCANVTKSGTVLYCEWHHDILVDEATGQLSMNSIVRDVSEQRQAEAEVRFLAYYDRLTRLPNRMQFEEVLRKVHHGMAERPLNSVAGIFLIDINSFKTVNDTYGRLAGDCFLVEVVRRIQLVLHEAETLARFEGDEFSVLVILEGGIEEAESYAKAIHRAMEAPVSFLGHQHTAMVSVGISFLGGPETPWQVSLQEADIALTAAKRQGVHSTKIFEEGMREGLLRRVQQENALRMAISRDEFRLVFQPLVDLETRKASGVEALLRWHPEGGAVSPDEFISVAEESELIVEIGDWVLRSAIEQATRWRSSGVGEIAIGVNVASKQLQLPDFVFKLQRWLAKAGLPPKTIQLEITERTLLTPTPQTLENFEALKRLGVLIALDDFGIGYSALAYLVRYPIDKIKIDRMFVREIGTGNGQAKLAEAILGMARLMQVRVIAEGVETAEQARHLQERGCHEVQGFLISRPLPADEVEAVLLKLAGGFAWEPMVVEAGGSRG
ncbi:putative bifunctional diguanylate cyclase/phosphodiesterase [Edaphobacter bradus]|uniref:putative bifunctional diguanylate cyclase/phosphodiesterase n=1 Tax=Edaphobacter bradus TaxID=2259016 RepID=UPI0021E0A680|nr:GGDEF domain-containing phosphodiesterase [Edaphobacter bradus]